MAGERDGKVRKKTDKNELLTIIDGKESARDRMIGVPHRPIGRSERKATPDPADGAIVFQYVNASRVGRSGRIVAVARYKIIDGHIGGGGPAGCQRVRPYRGVCRDDQGNRLTRI